MKSFRGISLMLILFITFVNGQDRSDLVPSKKISVESSNSENSLLNIGNITQWIRWNGLSGRDPVDIAGGIYPRGTASVIYNDGLMWGGIVRDTRNPTAPGMRVGGSTYQTGLIPGHIVTAGTATEPPVASNALDAHIYRVRPDWENLTISDSSVIIDAAEFFLVDPDSVTATMAQAVIDQYGQDWENWPANLGAPYSDEDSNNQYDPTIDIAGIPGADQTLWMVVNDLDEGVTTNLYGSPPMGLEMQITWWGYKGSGTASEVIFQRYRLINKSGFQIDSMFVSKWADADIGNYTNDFVGCDSSLQIAYAYNGEASDNFFSPFGLNPPAAGHILLQGPIVYSAGDTANFNLQNLPNYRNLPMTSFGYHSAGSAVPDPTFGTYDGTLMWYNLLNGFLPETDTLNPTPFQHGAGPMNGQATQFPLDGDPVFGFGDIDGQGSNFPPGDRRYNSATGPFDMAPGDVQEVVYGLIGGIGNNNLQSISKMKNNAQTAIDIHATLFNGDLSPVDLSYERNYLSPAETEIKFTAIANNITSINLEMNLPDGTPAAEVTLYDDGTHNDSLAGDGIWANIWNTSPLPQGVSVNANVVYDNGFSFRWANLLTKLSTSGPVYVTNAIIGIDNLNRNGIVNPGENVRYTVEIQNDATFNYSEVKIAQVGTLTPEYISGLAMPNEAHNLTLLSGNSSYSWPYASDSAFFEFQVSEQHPDSGEIYLEIEIVDENENRWISLVAISVRPFINQLNDRSMYHVAGNASGLLGYRITDSLSLQDYVYEVNFNDTTFSGEPLYELKNLTTASILASGLPYPDEHAYNSPVFDGFFATRGSTTLANGITGWDWEDEDERWLTGVNWGGSLFLGGADLGSNFLGSNLNGNEYNSIEIIFDSSLTSECAVFRRDLDYSFYGIGVFPGEAYDISNPISPRRVNICYVEDDNASMSNGTNANLIWDLGQDPSTGQAAALGAREYLFIMDSDYSGGIGYDDTTNLFTSDIVWSIWPEVNDGFEFMQHPGKLTLSYESSIAIGDIFRFNPIGQVVGIDNSAENALRFDLAVNYPNPFNPSTQINFTIPKNVDVRLEIFNVLGQRVKTLVKSKMSAGIYKMNWHGRNDNGERVSSGLYFYRIKAGDFIKTRKMILLK